MLRSRLFTTATSLDLSGIITDETGTGSLVFSTSPTIITPTFNGISTFTGLVSMTSGLTITPNATAPTSNVTIGPSAGANLLAAAVGNICIGSGAGDVLGASGRNVAIGTDALGAFSAGAASITNTTPGTGGTGAPTTYNNILLEKDSGVGEMAVYPTVNLRVSTGGAVDLITIASPGSGATVASGIVLRAVTTPAGVPTNWRGTLATVTGDNIAIGHNAGLLQSTANGNTIVGSFAGDAITTGNINTAVGLEALSSTNTGSGNVALGNTALRANTTGSSNSAIGSRALLANTTGSSNVAAGEGALMTNSTGSNNSGYGREALFGNTTGVNNSAIGWSALREQSSGSFNVGVGNEAGRFRGTGTDTMTIATSSVFIGNKSRAAGNSETNQVVIGGVDAVGDGSNTTVLGNSSTVSTRMAGTATSVLRINGNTVRVDNARTPASESATGNAGDICWDANNVYVCTATDTWKRAPLGNSATTTLSLPGLTVAIPATTASSSTTTGALTVAGGVGVAGNAWIGGTANVAGITSITNTTASTSTTTGALVVSGGLGVAGAIYPGGNVVMASGNGISFAATSDPSIPAVAATGTITRTATNVSDGDTVTLGAQVYTFKTTLTPADYEVLIGADAADSLLNLAYAINNSGGTPGTDYQVAAANASASAGTIVGSVLPLVAKVAGSGGNSIALVVTTAAAAWTRSATTLLGGRAAQGMTSELLDDYEVGTWTPQYLPSTGAFASISMEIYEARYARVGKIVTVTAAFRTSRLSIGTGSGNLRLSGLPYNPAGASGLTYSPGVCAWVGNQGAWASNTPQTVIASAGNPQLLLTGRSTVTGADSITQVSDMSESNNRNHVTLSVTYIVA